MSSKRRIRRQQCTGKVQYADSATALQAIFSLKARTGQSGILNPYRCAFCKQYHIGHAPGFVQRRLGWD